MQRWSVCLNSGSFSFLADSTNSPLSTVPKFWNLAKKKQSPDSGTASDFSEWIAAVFLAKISDPFSYTQKKSPLQQQETNPETEQVLNSWPVVQNIQKDKAHQGTQLPSLSFSSSIGFAMSQWVQQS